MTGRIHLGRRNSEPYQRLIELVKIRGSMLNGCAFCLEQEHAALAAGATFPAGQIPGWYLVNAVAAGVASQRTAEVFGGGPQ